TQGRVAKAPNASDNRITEPLGLRVPLENAPILEFEYVEALHIGSCIELTHSCDELLRSLQLIADERDRTLILPRNHDGLGDAPHVHELAIEERHLSERVNDKDAVCGGLKARTEEGEGRLNLLLGTQSGGNVTNLSYEPRALFSLDPGEGDLSREFRPIRA